MAVYLFGLALCLIALTLVVGALRTAFRWARRVWTLRQTEFAISVSEARPGDSIEARARVIPRPPSRAIGVHARLTCTMFDHGSHELYASSRAMRAAGRREGGGDGHDYVAKVTLPDYALRTGLVGDKSPDAVEGGRRMLVAWTVDLEVRSAAGSLLCRESRGLEVPRGRRPRTNLRRMSLLAIDTFTSIRNDMLLNWSVHLAICDGAVVDAAERRFLHDLLEEMAGMAAASETDARIEQERQRRLVIDDLFLGRYLPMDERLEFYRGLYKLARCDGPINPPEQAFLSEAARTFRLREAEVTKVQGEVTADEAVPVATS
ncbi:MAG TPA: TerB family tellurite resistance protein [Polyangia bacterium]